MANHALAGEAVLDTTTASLAHPLFDFTGWDAAVAGELGITPAELPRLVPTGWECGRVDGDGPALASGCIDAMAEQLVAGADQAGDVLVLLGTTLIVWVVAHEGAEVPGYVTIPHTASGNYLVGGPSNAGGLFRDWATRFLAAPADASRSIRARCRCGRRTRVASGCRSTTTRAGRRCTISTSRTTPPRSCAPPTRRRRSW